MEKEDLIAALDEVLNKKRNINDDTHKLHHEFVAMELEKRENRKILFKKFQSSLIGGIALGILGFLGWIGKLIMDSLHVGTH